MTSKTFRLSGKSMDRSWRLIDAKGIPLGRIASEAAKLLLGKHKPNYEPFLPMGDFVVIINTDDIVVTGTKQETKLTIVIQGIQADYVRDHFQSKWKEILQKLSNKPLRVCFLITHEVESFSVI